MGKSSKICPNASMVSSSISLAVSSFVPVVTLVETAFLMLKPNFSAMRGTSTVFVQPVSKAHVTSIFMFKSTSTKISPLLEMENGYFVMD